MAVVWKVRWNKAVAGWPREERDAPGRRDVDGGAAERDEVVGDLVAERARAVLVADGRRRPGEAAAALLTTVWDSSDRGSDSRIHSTLH